MKKYFIFILFSFFSISSFALEFGLGVIKPFDKTQNNSGKDEDDPFSPTLSISNVWDIAGYKFAPVLGYSQIANTTNDRYGGGYKIESLYLLYDLLYFPQGSQKLVYRYGIGAFQKRITGEGGTVTIPNGNSTITSYKPGSSKWSSTVSLNLGLDYKFGFAGSSIRDQGIRAELFILQPLSSTKRTFSSTISYILFY